MIVLGDQPQMQLEVVRQVLLAYREIQAQLVFPSFQKRRGHPWVFARPMWDPLTNIEIPETDNPGIKSEPGLRDVLKTYVDQIYYVEVENDSILRDVDTPADYNRERPD